ncbi:hypothetical protein J132_11051 [Termitomyces sp. J132]|nr:hypothetical protein H2248_006812 [Termitomyces sp. 'cryptogamus']KNZ78610.1 hypothetical protein J132_11051 [Termitomyces sp. J132]
MTLTASLQNRIKEIHDLLLVKGSPWLFRYGRRHLENDIPSERAAQFIQIMEHVSSRLGQLLDQGTDFILPWTPNTADRRIQEHFAKLRIPTLNCKPSLLCHGLGEPTAFNLNATRPSQTSRVDLLKSLFLNGKSDFDPKHSVLFNTSGAGKTRLVLEGLCREWGFYLTCSRQASQCGSADIEHVLHWPRGHLETCRIVEDPLDSQTVRENEDKVLRCFNAVLTARLLVFLSFLAAYEARVGKLAVKDITYLKKCWLLIQLDTRLLQEESCPDLLLELSTLLCHIEDPRALINPSGILLLVCKNFLGGIGTQIYCVIDEAQTAAEAYRRAFRSSSGNHRPLLRAMVKVWIGLGMQHVTTGTSLNIEDINDAISSTVGKYSDSLGDPVTDTGSFIEDDDQIEGFLRYYLPSWYLDSPSGKELLRRAKYWLRGRPRFIASYISCLIEHDIQYPHQILTKYIKAITEFVPADGEFWEQHEPPMTELMNLPIKPFNLTRAGNLNADLASAVEKLVCHRSINGHTDFERNGTSLVDTDLVECGFTRYPSSAKGRPTFDEPLAYLAADFWITAHRKSKHAYFLEHIHQNALGNNGLEQYTAICLAQIFRYYTSLSAYFDFSCIGNNRGLADKKARLVSCWVDSSETFRVAPVVSPISIDLDATGHGKEHASSPASILGYNSQDPWEDLLWLQCQVNAPFLFPQNEFGPDLMFRLQLEGGELLTVALQMKYKEYASAIETTDQIQSAVDSVNPDKFYINKRGQPHLSPELPQHILDMLDQLPNRYCAGQEGYHSLLCGLFACPTVSMAEDKQAYKKIIEEIDSGKVIINRRHEFFVMKFDSIEKLTRDLKPRRGLDNLVKALRVKEREKLHMQSERRKFGKKLRGMKKFGKKLRGMKK